MANAHTLARPGQQTQQGTSPYLSEAFKARLARRILDTGIGIHLGRLEHHFHLFDISIGPSMYCVWCGHTACFRFGAA